MFFRTPTHWQHKSPIAWLLWPLSLLYYALTQCRRWRVSPYAAPIPIICVGNITAGGTGKTPVALALAKLLQQAGITPCFLSRGYGGTVADPLKVDSAHHTAREVGDEPLLLAKTADCWIARNRIQGAKAAIAAGAQVIIMDDGFQNPSLIKTLSFIVIDGERGTGNGLMLPAGPLREPLQAALKRTDAVLLIGEDRHNVTEKLPAQLPLFHATIMPKEPSHCKDTKYIAFAGIGNPSKFFTTVENSGGIMLEKLAFPDHYPYTLKDAALLAARAEALGAELITTEKDAVRFPGRVKTLDISLHFEEHEDIKQLLKTALE